MVSKRLSYADDASAPCGSNIWMQFMILFDYWMIYVRFAFELKPKTFGFSTLGMFLSIEIKKSYRVKQEMQ